MPGPACYGNGGIEPTVTDANVVLGRLPPSLLGGEMALDTDASSAAVGKIARALNLDVNQAAQGILDIVNENMFGALRLVTVQKGLDPRDFALVAFGGGRPAAWQRAGNAGWMLPGHRSADSGSAVGARIPVFRREERVRAHLHPHHRRGRSGRRAHGGWTRSGEQARTWLREEGVSEAEQTVRFEADVRYPPAGIRVLSRRDSGPARQRRPRSHERTVRRRHEQLYGFRLDHPVELVNLRAVGAASVTKVSFPRFERGDPDPRDAVADEARVYFDRDFAPALVYHRARLRSGHIVRGPAIITQPDTTTVIHPGHVGEVDEFLNVLIGPAHKTL